MNPEWLGSLATSSAGSATTGSGSTITAADIERALESIGKLPPEPCGEFMREHGCPPESWCMVLPAECREAVGAPMFWPP